MWAKLKVLVEHNRIENMIEGLKNLGITALNEMQEAMYGEMRKGKNITLLSPTGSGKTIAYLLNLLERLDANSDVLQSVVILPTRELALQSFEVFQKLCKAANLKLKGMALYGGRPTMNEHRTLKEVHPQVVFATPGRFLDHLEKDNINAKGVKLLIIDEFDKCLEFGFLEEISAIYDYVKHARQVCLLSATDYKEDLDIVEYFDRDFSPLIFNATSKEDEKYSFFAVRSDEKDKLEPLGLLLTDIFASNKAANIMVFVSHRESAERVGKYLYEQQFDSVVYHGGLIQEQREKQLFKFRSGTANILVSTDLAARGLDIPHVTDIVHYHLPLKEEEFSHRSGRTARWDKNGNVYLLLGPHEQVPTYIDSINDKDIVSTRIKPMASGFASIYIGRGKKDKLSKADVVGFFCKKGKMKGNEIGNIELTSHATFVTVKRNQVDNLLRQISGEKIKGMKTIIERMKY